MVINLGKASMVVECNNEEWLNVINSGMSAPFVSGGIVHLPQGGVRDSEAAVVGGTYLAGAEPASYALDNGMKIIKSVVVDEISNVISSKGLACKPEDIKDVENFLTNILKNEFVKTKDEYMDNPDEETATEQVLNSISVKITVDDFDMSQAKEEVRNFITNSIRR